MREDAARSLHSLSILSTIRLLKTVDNCGKIIDKKRINNLVISMKRRIIKHSETTKKVNPFLVMNFKHRFSLLLGQLLGMNFSTSYVIHRLLITFA